jgi:hypothetical protein
LEKGKRLLALPGERRLCTRGKSKRRKKGWWFVLGHFYTTLNLEGGERKCIKTWLH